MLEKQSPNEKSGLGNSETRLDEDAIFNGRVVWGVAGWSRGPKMRARGGGGEKGGGVVNDAGGDRGSSALYSVHYRLVVGSVLML